MWVNKQGDIVEFETGKKLGKHRGYWYYTIGQRQGLGLGGGPWYVVAKQVEDNVVYISRSTMHQKKCVIHLTSLLVIGSLELQLGNFAG